MSESRVFKTKKAAKSAGLRTRHQWFVKFRAPRSGETAIVVKGDEFFYESQTEELFSRSKGQREIGSLIPNSEPVGVKRLPRRSVRYEVFRESDFVFEPKSTYVRNESPARSVDLLAAIRKVYQTASKFEAASKAAAKRKDHRRSRGFRSRMRNLLEIAELGMRRAIVTEQVSFVGVRGKVFRYEVEGQILKTRIKPPSWFEKSHVASLPTEPDQRSKCRLKDAIYTIEKLRNDPTLRW